MQEPLDQLEDLALMRELINMSSTCETWGCDRAVYLAVENRPRVQAIGRRYNEVGGFDFMSERAEWLEACLSNMLPPHPERKGDLRELDLAWDGIGDWRA